MPETTMKKRNTHQHSVRRGSIWATASALSLLLPAAAAWADGQIKFKIVDAKNGAVLPGATIVIKAGPRDLDDIQFNTAANGFVTTGDLDSGERTYKITAIVNGISYKELTGKIAVVDNQTIEVELKLEPKGEIVIDTKARVLRIDITDPSVYTSRDREHLQFFPNGVGNRQSLSKALRSVPGMVPNSQNRLHPRGESDNGTFYIDGFQLPSLLSGRAAQILTPDMLESIKVRTGNLAANFGGGSTILETSLRPAIGAAKSPLAPNFEYAFGGEEYGGTSQTFTFSRQLGTHMDSSGKAVTNPDSRAGYVLSYSRRDTNNFLESPQPQRQMSNNNGTSESLLGKFSYRINEKTEASAFVGSSGARNGVSNRQGLSSSFANRGQGYGFGGNSNATDFPRVNFQDGTNFAASQEILGNNVRQSDNHSFYALQFNRTFTSKLKGTISIGGADTRQDTTNRNVLGYPLTTGAPYSASTLPANYSIEYNPNTTLNFTQNQVQADFNYGDSDSQHAYKFGIIAQDLRGNEAYQFTPMSQAAANAVTALPYVGNSLRTNADNTTSPSMLIRRTGGYSAFYLQDTYTATKQLRLNVGVRVENFSQDQRIRFAASDPRASYDTKRSESMVSPRLNALYLFPKGLIKSLGKDQPMVLRFGYNRIVSAPGIGQGAIGLGQTGTAPLPVAAQTNDQMDFSIEQQLRGQTIRLSSFNKDLKNAHGWQQMIQGPQAGAFSMVNQGNATVNGFEMLYEIKPRSLDQQPGALDAISAGLSGYVSYTNSNAKRRALTGGGMVPQEFDQQQTVNVGAGYQLRDQSQLAVTYYHGSGLRSSVTTLGGTRAPIDQLDLRLRTRPRLISNLHTIEFGVENVTNSRNALNFAQGAAAAGTTSLGGTRFQQGRRLVLTLLGKF